MVVGTTEKSSGSSQQAASRKKQPLAVAACCSPSSKKSSLKTTNMMLQECVAGEVAQPAVGVSSAERQLWGEVFQSRQNFVDMHCC